MRKIGLSGGGKPSLQKVYYTISSNTNFSGSGNLYSLFGSPSTPVEAIFTIKSNVVVGESNFYAGYTLTTGDQWPTGSILKIIIESGATLTGHGGTQASDTRRNGGGALHVNFPTIIENYGTIQGGGGVGAAEYFGGDYTAPGGGGAGSLPGVGGIYESDYFGTNSSSGTLTAGGSGGSARGSVSTLYGGKGGDPGQDGGYGSGGGYHGTIGSGGYCIQGNSNVTWISTGTRHGSIT